MITTAVGHRMDSKRVSLPITKSRVVVSSNDVTPIQISNNSLQPKKETDDCAEMDITTDNNQSQISYRLVPLNSSQDIPNLSQTSCSGSQVLVMMPNNNNNIDNQNLYLKRTTDTFSKSVIDQKRRIMHKEIERKRRDKINDWIIALSKQVPDCASDHTKQGQSKGGILAKTAKYIQDLREENDRLNNVLREKEDISKELERTRQKIFVTESENRRLISLLKEHGITFQ